MEAYRLTNDMAWLPHTIAEGVQIKPMITKREHDLDVTCILVRVPAGKVVGEHIHPAQDDILYPLSGKGSMWVDGTGSFSLEPGMVVQVPRGTKPGRSSDSRKAGG